MAGDGFYYSNLLNEVVNNETFEDIPNEFQQTPPIKDSNPLSKANQKQKGKNFTEEEDELLVAGWLNVSTDPIHGTNQTRGTFWKRIYLFYEANRGTIAERTEGSLMHRWGAIQEAVSKFCGNITSIDGRNQSGMTIVDRVDQAERLFKEQDPNKKSFQFRHCWLKLRNQPKWLDKMQQLADARKSNKKQKRTKKSSPGLVDLTTQDGNEVVPPETAIPEMDAPQRPIGKKKAKEVLRQGGSDACKEALDILWAKKIEADAQKELKREERYEKSYALDKERLELDKERTYIKRIAEEQKIMSMDLSSMSELQKQYYMSLQAEILARRMN